MEKNPPKMRPIVPKISVVIPTYNRVALLRKAVESVLSQTFRDLELIVIDDGSTDGTVPYLQQLSEPRVKVIGQRNAGGGAARNRGIDAATGDMIAFLDSDDCFLPQHLEAACAAMGDDPDLAVYAPIVVDRGGGRSFIRPPRGIGKSENMADYLMRDRGFVPTSTLLVRAAHARVVRYNERLSYGQDIDFALRLFLNGVRFVMLAQPGAVVDETDSGVRLSVNRNLKAAQEWLESIRPMIPQRAYWGYRGWHVARYVAKDHWLSGVTLCAGAIARGCYRPRLALTVLAQVALRQKTYRRLSDADAGFRPLLRLAGFRQNDRALLP